MSKKMTNRTEERDVIFITDQIANLCTELASLFRSLSKITRTCLGLKESLEIRSIERNENEKENQI